MNFEKGLTKKLLVKQIAELQSKYTDCTPINNGAGFNKNQLANIRFYLIIRGKSQ